MNIFCPILFAALAVNTVFAGTINPGSPGRAGTDTFSVQDQLTGTVTTVTVPIGTPLPTPAAKATAIGAAFVKAGIPAVDVIVSGSTVTLLGFTTIAGTSSANESSKLAFGLPSLDPAGPTFAMLDYHLDSGFTSLSGMDASGAPAIYTGAFSFTDSVLGTISLSTSIAFASLPSTSVAALLQSEFTSLNSQLSAQAPSLSGMLKLDIPNSSIDLSFRATVSIASVTNSDTDVALVSSESITGAPEPLSLILVGSGILMLLIRATFLKQAAHRLGPCGERRRGH